MPKNLFSGLEDFGFNDINNVDLYKKEINQAQSVEEDEEERQKSLLYDTQITCPVCDFTFKARTVKTSAYRILSKDSDSFIRYSIINPYFYDVWVCDSCGYSSMKSDFKKIRGHQVDAVKEKITSKWRSRQYPDVYNVDIAIERYKLSLLNYFVMQSKSSIKAMNCLKLAWMYRLKNDEDNELTFLKQALNGFNDAYFNEDFPIYGMNKFSCMYLIGELNRRIGNNDEASIWFSRVVSTPGAPQKTKDRAREQRDLIKEEENAEKENTPLEDLSIEDDKDNKKGFFSRFFK